MAYIDAFRHRFGVEPGVDFVSLVPRLDFISKKANWGGTLRRPVVRIGDKGYEMIAGAFTRHVKSPRL